MVQAFDLIVSGPPNVGTTPSAALMVAEAAAPQSPMPAGYDHFVKMVYQ
jgi:hypothetical protein